MLDVGHGDGTASATVVARKGIRVVQVRYSVPATVPVGRGATDPKHYAAATATAVEVARDLLK